MIVINPIGRRTEKEVASRKCRRRRRRSVRMLDFFFMFFLKKELLRGGAIELASNCSVSFALPLRLKN